MNRQIILSVGGTTAGLLTTAFLPAAGAFADPGIGTAGEIANTALSSPLGATAPLGVTGALTPDVSTPSSTPLGDIGGTGGLTPLAGLTPDTGTPDATPGDTAPADSDSFTIGQDTFTPIQADGSAGFTPLSPLFGAAPFFQAGSGDQSFDVASGTGPDATDLGNVTASEDVMNLFGGIHNTEFTITGVDPASGTTDADLPAVGSVYDVTNFGNGWENIYTAIPGADGSASTITDTLMTPFGDFNIPTDFDASAPLDPGAAFDGVSALGSDAADVAGGVEDAIGSVDPLDFLGI